jgi:predicted DNA-binding transcriptional regulator AlpA
MAPYVRTEDLIDAQGVAELLGLRHRNSVSTYQRRYPDMPKPVVDLGPGRPLLWVRPEIEGWARRRRHPAQPVS